MSEPKLNIKEETSTKKTRSPPKKAKVEQTVPKKKKLKTDADKAAEKAQHLRFGKAELTPDELSRLSKAQKREMYAAHAARSAVHHEVDQYEDENVGVQALSEGEKAAGNVRDISKSRYARKLKKKAKMQGKKGTKTARSSAQKPTSAQDAGASGTGEGGSNWLSRWKQRQEIHKSYYAAARSGTAAQTVGGKAASNGASAARSSMEQAVEKGKTAVNTAVKGLMNAAKGNAHVLVIVGVFLLLILMVTLVDDYHTNYSDGSGQQFITLVSKSGSTFYLVIDRNAKGQQTVHFMNLVDEADLLALMEEDAADAYTAEKEAAAQAEQEKLEQQGYEIKRGKHTSVKGARQKRFIRFRTLGAGYSEDEIKAVIAGEAEHRPHQKQPPKEQPFHLLVDIQAKLSEGKSEGYARWAKRYNLKEMSKTLIFLQENKIGSIEEMQERVDAATARYHELGDSIKASENRLAEIAVLKAHITNYAKTRPVYDAYRKTGYSKRFLETHRTEITLHKAAKAAFDEANLKKLPKVKELDVEYSKLLTEKKVRYPDYRKAKEEMQELLRAKRNVEMFFAEEKSIAEKMKSR